MNKKTSINSKMLFVHSDHNNNEKDAALYFTPSFRRLKTCLPSDEYQILHLPVYKRFTFSHKNNTYSLVVYSFFTYRMPRQK